VAAEDAYTHNAEVRSPLDSDEEELPLASTVTEQTPGDKPPATLLAQGSEPAGRSITEWRREFTFPGVLAMVPEHREQVMEFVSEHCPDQEKQLDLLVAVQEALANAALHGCRDDASTMIHCVVRATADEITISVRDPGPGFPLEKAHPDNYKVTTLSHGRGIVMIRSLVDEVSFAHHGAEIVLRKRMIDSSNKAAHP
jgi:serine/threonine-protein kinase RsbW